MNCLDCDHHINGHSLNGCGYFGFGLPRCNCKRSPGEAAMALYYEAWSQAHRYYCNFGILCDEHGADDAKLFMEDM